MNKEMAASWRKEAWEEIKAKVGANGKRIGDGFPHASVGGRYVLEPAHWWTAGFWPGLLWLVYRDNGSNELRELAESCERQLDRVVTDYYRLDHDIGFMWTLTSVARYKLTGEEESKRRALLAANLLAARFNPQGSFIRAWNPWSEGEDNAGWAIIDCMMNLPLLYWASGITGDPRFRQVAVRHADTVLEHFLRQDGSVHHIVVFDPATGDRLRALGGQGYAPDSAWSRGTAWAVYGLALSALYTGDHRYLDAAKRTAYFFLSQLPADGVSVWDFRLPEGVPAYKDSSAGACAACGMLLLSDLTAGPEKAFFAERGERLLKSLRDTCGTAGLPEEEGLLLHGTSHFPDNRNVDVPLIYGDYFYAEGIARLLGYGERFW